MTFSAPEKIKAFTYLCVLRQRLDGSVKQSVHPWRRNGKYNICRTIFSLFDPLSWRSKHSFYKFRCGRTIKTKYTLKNIFLTPFSTCKCYSHPCFVMLVTALCAKAPSCSNCLRQGDCCRNVEIIQAEPVV